MVLGPKIDNIFGPARTKMLSVFSPRSKIFVTADQRVARFGPRTIFAARNGPTLSVLVHLYLIG